MTSTFTTMEATHAADTEFLVKKSMSSGYRLFSVLTPPVYTAFVLMQRGRGAFSVNRLLRATWLGGAVGACFAVILTAKAQFSAKVPLLVVALSTRALRTLTQTQSERGESSWPTMYFLALLVDQYMISYYWPIKTTTIRAEDHSTIGALLFALLTPAILWKRARTVHCEAPSPLKYMEPDQMAFTVRSDFGRRRHWFCDRQRSTRWQAAFRRQTAASCDSNNPWTSYRRPMTQNDLRTCFRSTISTFIGLSLCLSTDRPLQV